MSKDDFLTSRGEQDLFDPVLSDLREWPIYKVSRQREEIVDELTRDSIAQLREQYPSHDALWELMAETYYSERERMKNNPWKVDPKDEKEYWTQVKRDLKKNRAPDQEESEVIALTEKLLQRVVHGYAEEIVGDFKIPTYKFAKRFTNFGFARLFNAATEGVVRGIINPQKQLLEKILLTGHLEMVRSLSQKGTILLLPTHFSNLDSLVLGWGIDALGLPAFTYGAGINLFGHPVLSYFMSRLGAYRVDRRKKHDVYLTVLKNHSRMALEKGCHMLFFPGGTRSRSGAIETRLKLGLLGTAVEAQRNHIMKNPKNFQKIFVVPMTISYHFVLEAANLIDEHLKRRGKERFLLLKDDFSNVWKDLKFLWKFFDSSSEMMLRFGQPMDLFGNPVDEEGVSIDKFGRPLDISGYFTHKGKLNIDHQREAEFTRALGEVLLEAYYKENTVFSSHLIAHVAFRHFRAQHKSLDIFELLRVPEEDFLISMPAFRREVAQFLEELKEMAAKGKIQLANHLDQDLDSVIEHGLSNLGVYHPNKPLFKDKSGFIATQDLKLLYFYHNRLKGYDR